MKLGRAPRTFNPRVPHLSAVLGSRRLSLLPPPPAQVDWTKGLPADLGAMLNNVLGDCTCAAVYHSLQVWLFNAAQRFETQPDADVQQLYEKACGYDPTKPETDRGGVEQNVLSYWVNQGAPVTVIGEAVDKLTAFFEVDPRNPVDIQRTIADCGVCYIGIDVPAYLMSTVGGNPGAVWDLGGPDADQAIIGGHAVILSGYDGYGLKVISWGKVYTMTWPFFQKYCDEAYGLVSRDWVTAKGTTPMGMTLDQLDGLMAGLKTAS